MTQGMMPDGTVVQGGERRTAERQISVLINAGVSHDGGDSLCRIRNLSSGGVMIECGLPLAVGEDVEFQLKSGHYISGNVRWTKGEKAGVAFLDPSSAALVKGGGVAARPVSGQEGVSPIGYPLFRRKAIAVLENARGQSRAPVLYISPGGLVVENTHDWGGEKLFTVTLGNLGRLKARVVDDVDDEAGHLLVLNFVEPPLYKLLNNWLKETPMDCDEPAPLIPVIRKKSILRVRH